MVVERALENRRKRGSLDIMADILYLLEGERRSKTAIMRLANLNLERANKYIRFLLSKNLVAQVKYSSSVKFEITARGVEFLRDYERLKEAEEEVLEALKRLEGLTGLEGAR